MLAVIFAILFAGLGHYLYIQSNDFPYWYHPDEYKKGYYIMQEQQERTFAHPALLLETGNLVRQWMGVIDQHQEAVVCGRYASALLAAIGVFGFTLAGYRMQGLAGLVLCGLATSLCPPLLVHAHYFKEDTALMAGVGIATLGIALVASGSRTNLGKILSAAVLGIGCGMSVSGKYVGIIMLLPAIVSLVITRSGKSRQFPLRAVVFAACAIFFTLVINFRAFAFDGLFISLGHGVAENIGYEVDHGLNGHYNIALNFPNTFALRMAMSDVMIHIWIVAGLGLIWFLIRPRISRDGIAVLSILITWILALSFNAIPIPRYSLPISVLIYFISSLLLARAVADWITIRKSLGFAMILIAACAIGYFQFQRSVNFNQQFADDSRVRVRAWIAANIPAGTVVPADSYAGLQEPGDPIRHPEQADVSQVQITQTMFAADTTDDLESLANSGVQYVITAWPAYMRFLDPEVHGWPRGTGNEKAFNRRKQFYLDLFAKGEIACQFKPDQATHSYVNPEITIYNISKLATRSVSQKQKKPPILRRMFGL